ncbi:hypothetical protein ABZ897_03440 [Nonomuraea sp. NPDC046802]|uniref:hypothetical protein n=1 Tax=Nonomuraea sp. NPDC046802 TaxID=3154919 RepID=UPI0033D602EB
MDTWLSGPSGSSAPAPGELLDRILILNERHLTFVFREYLIPTTGTVRTNHGNYVRRTPQRSLPAA